MDFLSVLLLFGAGCLAGFLAGFFGVGGGIILVPILIAYFQAHGVSSLIGTHLAFGTSLLVVIFASLASSYRYWHDGHVLWKPVVLMGVASVAGALVGSGVAAGLEGSSLRKIFAGVVLLASLRLLNEPRRSTKEAAPNLGAAGLIVTGLIVGVISSLAGVGGGLFSIPIMYTVLHFPLKKALGTSSATIVITATAAAAGYIMRGWGNILLPPGTLGFVDYIHAIPVIVGTIPFSTLGATMANRTKPESLKKIYAVFLLVIAVRMFFF
ncbi:MAG: sulfite exporter TauE/SafE family protein [Bacteroidota bacterium]